MSDSLAEATVKSKVDAAEIEANPANYYINIHSENFPAGAIRGQLAAAPADTVTVMVMKHNRADVTSMAEFEAVEARAVTNSTTPDAAFGPTVETVLERPTVVLPGDTQSEGAVAGGERHLRDERCLRDRRLLRR